MRAPIIRAGTLLSLIIWLLAFELWAVDGPSATQSCNVSYNAGGSFQVTNRFVFAGDLLSIVWLPHLPSGWQISAATGSGAPEISGGAIVWAGQTLATPLDLVYTVSVPAGANGPQALSAEVEYQLDGMVNPARVWAAANPISLNSSATTSASATHQTAGGYRPGARLTITNRFSFAQPLLSLLWRARLPADWKIIAVAGGGNPELSGNEILWNGPLPASPIVMTYDVRVGNLTRDTVEVRAEVEYQFSNSPNAQALGAGPDPMRIPQDTGTIFFNHSSGGKYRPGLTVTITNDFTFPDALISLLWRPVLPANWTLESVVGPGNPEIVGGEVLWPSTIPASPFRFTYTVKAPSNESGPKQIDAQVEYQTADLANPFIDSVNPGALNLADDSIVDPPRFASPSWNNGKPTLTLQLLPARTWRIEFTTNFTQWSTLLTTNVSGSFSYTDATAPIGRRFYRAVVPPQ